MPLDQNPNTAPADPLWELDVETIGEAGATEMLRLAEMRQEAIFRASLGMDQRASVYAAGLTAAAGALIAAAAATQSSTWLHATLVVAVGLGFAAVLSAYACRPQNSQFPGLTPIVWSRTPGWFNEPKRNLAVALAADLQSKMAENEQRQIVNGRYLTAAMVVAAVSPVIAAVVSLLT